MNLSSKSRKTNLGRMCGYSLMNMSPTFVEVNLVGSILESMQVKNTAVGEGLSRTFSKEKIVIHEIFFYNLNVKHKYVLRNKVSVSRV